MLFLVFLWITFAKVVVSSVGEMRTRIPAHIAAFESPDTFIVEFTHLASVNDGNQSTQDSVIPVHPAIHRFRQITTAMDLPWSGSPSGSKLNERFVFGGVSDSSALPLSGTPLLLGVSVRLPGGLDDARMVAEKLKGFGTVWPALELRHPAMESPHHPRASLNLDRAGDGFAEAVSANNTEQGHRPWYHQLSRRLFSSMGISVGTLTYSSNGRLEPIRVGIIDSGVDYRHPALGGCFGLGCRVRYGFDFTSDLSDPMDCTGHGTHVAGLIAARNDPASLVRGVFPDAVIGAYKIFGCHPDENVLGEDRSEETRDSVQENGTSQQRKTGVSKKKKSRTTSDALIAAMEMAVRDGMDVVNLSVGGLSSWPEFPEARAAQAMIERGIVVVAAQGNHAIDGPWSVSSPAIASGVISVAATETDYFLGGTATAGSIDASESFSFNYSSIIDITAVLFKSQNNPVKHVTRILYTDSEVCTDTSLHQFNVEQMLRPWVLVLKRGNCTVSEKASIAALAGASSVLIYNSEQYESDDIFRFVLQETETIIPAAGISRHVGEKLRELCEAFGDDAIVRWDSSVKIMDNFHAFERPADFSSFGPSPHLDVKPDIAAPGTFIISTYLTTNGSYAILSGTSMSTPLIAGTAALLLSHRPSLTPIQVKSLLMNTASPGKGLNGAYPHPAVIGSGIAKVTAAMSSPLIFEPPSIALGYLSSGDTVFVDAKLKWVDRIPGSVTYKVHVEGPVPLELITTGKSTFTTGNLTSPWNCTVDVSPSVITIGTAFPSAKVRFTVTPTSRSSSYHTLLLHGGHIIATPLQLSHSQPSLRIPFQFVTGDNTYSGALICRYEATCIPTFTISNHTILQFSLLMPVTSVTVFLLNTETGMNVGYIDAAEFLGKSGKNHPRYAVEWNGGSVYGNSKRDVKILALANVGGGRWLRKKSLREHKEKLHGIQRGSYRVCIEAMFDVMGMNNPVRDRWCSHRFKRSL